MQHWLDIALTLGATLSLVPAATVGVECLAALSPARRRSASSPARPRVAVLIPAHNEEAGLADTLRTIAPQLVEGDRLLVVADNCEDRTAEVARAQGAEVLERADAERRGKGFALDAGLKKLADAPPDVLIMIDADCDVADGAIDALARQAAASNQPAQALYLMTQPPEASPTQSISALAFLIKNHVRPRGLGRFGFPCLLTGTGMAFPWSSLKNVDLASGNIVEDMQMGIDLALAGESPEFCEAARVTGRLPTRDQAAIKQRTRWEHGHLRTLFSQAPRLAVGGFVKAKPSLLALALELAVPPLSLLIVAMLAGFAGTALFALLRLISWRPASIFATGLFVLLATVLLAWFRFGRKVAPASVLLAAPFYVAWKLPMYLAFLGKREKRWVRTERDPAAPPTASSAKS